MGLGIPTGIYLNHLIEKSTEKERKRKILLLLRTELIENHLRIAVEWSREGKVVDKEMTTLGALLKDDSWTAFSESGELKWIRNPNLLSRIAQTYSEIRYINICPIKISIWLCIEKTLHMNIFHPFLTNYG